MKRCWATKAELIGRSTTQRFFDPRASGHPCADAVHPTQSAGRQAAGAAHLAEQSPGTATEWTLVRADGETLVAEILVNVLTDEAGRLTGYLAMAHDVTQRRHAEDQLQHVAMHDALTTLPNRNMLQDFAQSQLGQQSAKACTWR